MRGRPLVAERVTAKLNDTNRSMHNSHKLGYVINWKQNVNNVQADSNNGPQPEISQSQKN